MWSTYPLPLNQEVRPDTSNMFQFYTMSRLVTSISEPLATPEMASLDGHSRISNEAATANSAGQSDYTDKLLTLSQKAAAFLDKGSCTDVVFLVGPDDDIKKFPAHRLILALNSPFFQNMFFGEAREDVKEIRIPDVTPKIFENLLRWCYTDYSTIGFDSVEDAVNMYQASTKFAIHSLQEKSKMYAYRNLCQENVLNTYEFACQAELYDIVYNCLKMIDKNAEAIIASKSFTKCSLSTLISVLRRSSLDIPSEGHILNGVIEWGKEECKRQGLDSEEHLRKVLEPVLPYIRFLTMSAEEVVSFAEKHGIPPPEEMCSLLVRISNPETGLFPMRGSLCPESEKRKFAATYWFAFRNATNLDLEELSPKDTFSGTIEITGSNIFFFGFLFPKFQQAGGLTLKLQCKAGSISVEGDVRPDKIVKTPAFAAYYIPLPKCVYVKDGNKIQIDIEITNCLPNFQYLNIGDKELVDEHKGLRFKICANSSDGTKRKMICIPEMLVFF